MGQRADRLRQKYEEWSPGSVATPMGEAEIDAALASLAETLEELRPVAEEECPTVLLGGGPEVSAKPHAVRGA